MSLASLKADEHLPITLTYPCLSDQEFAALCAKFPDSIVEYSSDGTVTIMPPTDPETGFREALIIQQLTAWALRDAQGFVSTPDSGFRLPGGARRSPDASWYNAARWKKARKTGMRFPVFAPEFVIELRSPDDKPSALRDKMQECIDNGVQLGWLIDPIKRRVEIYRPGRDPEVLSNPAKVSGERPIAGFVLDLDRIL
jgi:Uma2 family endonuclease